MVGAYQSFPKALNMRNEVDSLGKVELIHRAKRSYKPNKGRGLVQDFSNDSSISCAGEQKRRWIMRILRHLYTVRLLASNM